MYTNLEEAGVVGIGGLLVLREAGGESYECKLAVAFSLENRILHPKWWGTTFLQVIRKRYQYSSMTAPGDPNLTRWPDDSTEMGLKAWRESLLAVSSAHNHTQANPVPGADSYYDISIKPPVWAKPDMFVRQIGRVRFYNLDRDYEQEALKTA